MILLIVILTCLVVFLSWTIGKLMESVFYVESPAYYWFLGLMTGLIAMLISQLGG